MEQPASSGGVGLVWKRQCGRVGCGSELAD